MNDSQKNTLSETAIVRQSNGFQLRRTPCCINLYDEDNLPVLSLNNTSAMIWENCTGHFTVGVLVEQFSNVFPDVPHEKMRTDVLDVLIEFEREEVIELS